MNERRSFLKLAGSGVGAGAAAGLGAGLAHWLPPAQAAQFAQASHATPAATAGPAVVPAAAPLASVAALRAAGLDPFETYCRIFAATTVGAECAWWFMGALPRQVEDVGPVDWVQEETIRVHHVEVPGPGELNILWREVGVFRDITTGLVPTAWYDPARGESVPQTAQLRGGPSRHLIRKSGEGVAIALQVKDTIASGITLDGRITGDRVCLTHVEEKRRVATNAPATVLRTVFKVYASLAELRGSGASVAASGYYGVRNLTTGNVFVNGLMQKAALDEKVNALAWERVKAKAPEFFDGERLAPRWQEA